MDNLLVSLWSLFCTIRGQEDPDGVAVNQNIPERFCWFVKNSESGENCRYARQYAKMFEERDYEMIRDSFLETLDQFRKLEGDDFGR